MSAPHNGRRREVAPGPISDQLKSWPIDVGEILSGLSGSEAEAIMKMTQDRRYQRGTYVYELGEHQQGLYLAKTGLIEEFRLTESGNKLPMSRIVQGQFFGFSSVDGHYCCFAEAIEESVVGFLPFKKLENIYQNFPTVAGNMVQALMWRLGEIEQRLELVAFGKLRARVAWAILGLSAVHGPTLSGTTHEALATWAASSRPKVSQVLEELQQAGILRLARSEIQICDPTRLEEWAKSE